MESSSPPLASYPVEERVSMGSTNLQLQKANGEEKWKRHCNMIDVTPQTQASTPNTSLAVHSPGSEATMQQQHHQQHTYWTPPQEERSSYRHIDDSFHPPDNTTPAILSQQDIAMDLHGMSTNHPIETTPTCTPPSLDYNTAVVDAAVMPSSSYCRVMRDSTNTSSEVESRALFPESDEDDDKEELAQRYDSPEQRNCPKYCTELEPPHKQWGGIEHDLEEHVAFTSLASRTAVVTNNEPRSRAMKSRRNASTSSSPDHHHHHHHVLADSAVAAPYSSQLPHQHQQHRTSVRPLQDHHQRNLSVDSSLSTLSSLDGTFDGSVQTSPHPYRPSSVLVVSSRNSVLRRSTLTTTALADSHSLPPPPPSQKYHDKSYNNTPNSSNNNNNNHDLNTSSAFGDADGGTRGVRTAAKSLLRLAATTRGLLWIMCFMALSSVSMTVLTSRMLKSHEEMSTMHMEKPGSGSVLFPPGNKHRVLIPVKNQQHEVTTRASMPNAPAARPTAVKSKENKSTAIENRKVRRKTAEIKRDKPKQQQQQPEKKVTAKPKQVTTKPLSRGKDKDTKIKTKQHNHEVDIKPKTDKSTLSFKLKAVKQPKGMISDKRRETVDHKLYRIKASLSTKGQALEQSSRVVYLHESLLHQKPKHRKIVQYPADFTDSTQLYSVLDSSDERVSKSMELRQPYVQGECVPMKEWQTTFHPSCNTIHALGVDRLGETEGDRFDLFGTKGFWRNAWKVDVKSGQNRSNDGDVVVLKTLKIQHKFEEAHFEHDRIDAVAMERLTSSPHVIDVFGFCGHSVLSEYANGKRLGALADKSRSTPLARLRIARDIATGLADVHGIDGDGNTTFVHLDVNPANVVSVGGTLKLNDFNIGIIRRWNTTSNEPCGFPAQYPNPQWRSPEEARNEMNLTEKVDVFSMGHIFFRLICGHEPWNKLEPGGKPSKAEMTEKVTKGTLPTIPSSVLQSTDKEVVAIREAMLQCYQFNPKDRPSAREIADALQRVLDDVGKK